MTRPPRPPAVQRIGAVEVLDPGPRTTIQDLGRPGHAHLGIPASGAADPEACTLANRLVGNPEGAATLETTLRGPVLRFREPATVALAGADVDASVDGRPVAMRAPFRVTRGGELQVGVAVRGLRTYIAIRGGIDAPRVLGSASSDQLTGLGPAPLRVGDRLDLDALALAAPTVDVAPVATLTTEATLHVVPGPRDDWFAPDALTTLVGAAFTVGPAVDRIGARLHGPALTRRNDDELRSEGMVRGALQVPPSGDPILLLADHPTTGGYPVIAVLAQADLSRAGQLRPGDTVRFRLLPRRPAVARSEHVG